MYRTVWAPGDVMELRSAVRRTWERSSSVTRRRAPPKVMSTVGGSSGSRSIRPRSASAASPMNSTGIWAISISAENGPPLLPNSST